MARILADDSFKCIFLNGNDRIPILISLKFVPWRPISNKLALVQVMAWCRTWTNDYPVNWRIYAALGGGELNAVSFTPITVTFCSVTYIHMLYQKVYHSKSILLKVLIALIKIISYLYITRCCWLQRNFKIWIPIITVLPITAASVAPKTSPYFWTRMPGNTAFHG